MVTTTSEYAVKFWNTMILCIIWYNNQQ